MRRNVIETVMGAVVLIVAAYFLVFSYTSADIGTRGGYEVTAKFDQLGGLAVGSPVRISGIKVGTVERLSLEPRTFLAVATLSIEPTVKLPADTTAKVASEGLLGGRYIALEPGGEDKMIKAGGEITLTQSAINLEDLVSRYMFSSGGQGGKQGGEKQDGEKQDDAVGK